MAVGTPILVALGISFHICALFAILDCYFRSPVVHGMPPQRADIRAPASRLVFVVADGLRADTLFEQRDLYLRRVIETQGRWGVSHARVPTESRPGHVALLAGMYEDLGAVTRGWRENPVEFDSFLNRSTAAWAYGSPDIVPMFATRCPHVEWECYSKHDEDFKRTDASQLDVWSFERLHATLNRSHTDRELWRRLHQEGVVIFLHLLGIDTNGHAFRPHSIMYKSNVVLVDRLMEGLVRTLDSYYNDDKRTAYIFTSDHGMSARGSHGDEHPHNTETPLVVWGAGIGSPEPQHFVSRPVYWSAPTTSPPEWGLDHLLRTDIHQADVAPLAASLLALPVPVNSVGVLPVDLLTPDLALRASTLAANARQIHELLLRKDALTRQSALLFRPFPRLQEAEALRSSLERDRAEGAFDKAIAKSFDLVNVSLAGITHYERHDQPLLQTLLSLGYFSWGAFVFVAVTRPASAASFRFLPSPSCTYERLVWLASGALCLYLLLDQSPISYFAYLLFPSYFIAGIVRNVPSRDVLSSPSLASPGKLILQVIGGAALLEALVFAYFQRAALSVAFIVVAFGRPLMMPQRTPRPLLWCALCLSLSVFPLLPTALSNSLPLVLCGVAITSALCLFALWSRLLVPTVSFLHLALLAAVALVCVWGGHAVAWSLLVVSLASVAFVPALSPSSFLLSTGIGLLTAYSMLSISYEAIFMCGVCALLWLWLEPALRSRRPDSPSAPSAEAVQDALLYYSFTGETLTPLAQLIFTYATFFGTGNVASIASFEISSVYRFITVFSPFLMASLLLLKLLIPFALVAVAYTYINRMRGIADQAGMMIATALSSLMSLTFFFLVRTEGSWRDIGMSLSHVAIANSALVLQLLMLGLAQLLLRRCPLPYGVAHRD